MQQTKNTGTQPGKQPQAKELTEAEFIAEQANRARDAMKKVTADLTNLVKGGVDLPRMMGDHPWVTLGGAVAAGFAVASALTPSRDETLIERIKSLMPEEAAAPAPSTVAAGAPAEPTPGPTAAAQAKNTAGGGVTAHIVDALKTALVSTLTSAISAKVATQPDAPQGNGHAAASAGA